MKQKDLTSYERPKQLHPNNTVIHWYEKDIELLGTSKNKVLRFIEEECIKKITNWEFDCLPIKDYNKTTHHVQRSEVTGLWTCSCQFNKQNGGMCSHIKACKVFNFMNDWNGGGVE